MPDTTPTENEEPKEPKDKRTEQKKAYALLTTSGAFNAHQESILAALFGISPQPKPEGK